MTAVSFSLPFDRADDGRSEWTRWGTCLAVVLAFHVAAGVAVSIVEVSTAPPPAPPAVMLEMAPEPVAPAVVPVETVTQVQPVTTETVRPVEVEPVKPVEPVRAVEPVVEKIEMPDVQPVLDPEVQVAVAVPPPPPRPKPVVHKPLPPRPVPEPTPAVAPPAMAPVAPPAPVMAAPVANPTPAPPSHVMPTFQSQLLAHLNRHKRYPNSARLRRQQGVAYLRFTMDRQGHVLASNLQRSSGAEILDEEVLAMIKRAEPLPAVPPEITDQRLEFIVPVRFDLR